jgi:hypothetical protein
VGCCQLSAPPLLAETASLIEKETDKIDRIPQIFNLQFSIFSGLGGINRV